MDAEKNKKIILVISVICIAVAAVLLYSNANVESGPPGGVGDMAYKCTQCGSSQMVNRDTAMKMAKQQGSPGGFGPPALNCPSCNAPRAMMPAQKCAACGEIFFAGEAKDPQSPMKCPKCGEMPQQGNGF